VTYEKQIELLTELKRFQFLKDCKEPFTVSEIQELIEVVFKRRLETINYLHTSYGIKHLLERVSHVVCGGYKYCSEGSLQEAFKLSGFRTIKKGTRELYNISERELRELNRLK